jgi:hypothetical protein
VVAAAAFPVYLIWLFSVFGLLAPFILMAAQVGMWGLDGITFLLAALLTPKANALRVLVFLPAYSPFYGLLMKFVRLAAYLEEWILQSSYSDTYVPGKVHKVRR